MAEHFALKRKNKTVTSERKQFTEILKVGKLSESSVKLAGMFTLLYKPHMQSVDW